MTATNVRGTQITDGSVDLGVDVGGVLPVANGGTGNTTGRATSAVRADSLTTPRNINGTPFDGSAAIVIKVRDVSVSAPGATPSINADVTDQATFTGVAAAITSMTTNLTGTFSNGQKLMIRFTDNGTAQTIAWGASFLSSGVALLLTTTVASKTHMCGFVYDSAKTAWICMAVDAIGY